MQHLITPYAKELDPYYWWEGAFSEQELNFLQSLAKNASKQAVVGANRLDPNIRRSNVHWADKKEDTAFAFERLADVASKINLHYGFDLTGFAEPLQLANYNDSEQGMYGWHQDFGKGISRKLSLVVQLTDPSEYEGGNLEIMAGGTPLSVKKQRGLIAIFPSYAQHQVTPVIKGSRQSLVTWIAGPNFR